jgi:hypothetical protein
MIMNIFETLKKLNESKRKDPSYIYLDENNQIKEIPLSKLDSAGALMKKKQNPAKLIDDSIFGK